MLSLAQMYPPKKTDDITEWLSGLLESLSRAGLEFGANIGLDETAVGYEVKVFLQAPIPEAGWGPLKEYIPAYSIQAGWFVEDLRQTRRTLSFTASKA